MSLWTIVVIAISLAMDATAVAAARGLAAARVRARDVVLVAGLFGGFQALMPLLGWFLGSRLGPFVQAWDHWIAFGLLGAIGAKMLVEAIRGAGKVDAPSDDLFALRTLLVLAVATSIDAFAVGITLPMLGAPFLLSIAVIGVVTAALSGLGLLAGHRIASSFGRGLEALAGLVLIGIGAMILVDHLRAGTS